MDFNMDEDTDDAEGTGSAGNSDVASTSSASEDGKSVAESDPDDLDGYASASTYNSEDDGQNAGSETILTEKSSWDAKSLNTLTVSPTQNADRATIMFHWSALGFYSPHRAIEPSSRVPHAMQMRRWRS